MRENRTYGSVRGGQSNLIPSTRLTGLWPEGCGGGFAAIFKKGGAASAAGCVEGLHRFAQGATAALPLRVMVAPFGAQRTQFALCELDL